MQTVRQLRLEMGYSIGEMALCLGLSKATFQVYDNGRTPPPEGLLDNMLHQRAKDAAFMAGIPARVDERLKAEGIEFIKSEKECEE